MCWYLHETSLPSRELGSMCFHDSTSMLKWWLQQAIASCFAKNILFNANRVKLFYFLKKIGFQHHGFQIIVTSFDSVVVNPWILLLKSIKLKKNHLYPLYDNSSALSSAPDVFMMGSWIYFYCTLFLPSFEMPPADDPTFLYAVKINTRLCQQQVGEQLAIYLLARSLKKPALIIQ